MEILTNLMEIEMMSNRLFNALRWIAQYLLPGVSTLYFALATIWGFGYGEQVIGTLAAVNIFLGGILGLNRAVYNANNSADGILQLDTSDPERDLWSLELATPLDDVANKSKITLDVARRAIE